MFIGNIIFLALDVHDRLHQVNYPSFCYLFSQDRQDGQDKGNSE